MLKHANLKLPDLVAVFAVPPEGVRRHDEAALVYDVAAETGSGFGTPYLRHYSFFDRWFAINVSLDADGAITAEPVPYAGLRWAFNCDIATPMITPGPPEVVARVDLVLDVLAAPDGRVHIVKDEEEFEAAVAAGWITASEAAGARRGLAELRDIVNGPGLAAFCRGICPFAAADDLRRLPPQSPVTFPPFAAAAFLFGDRTNERE